MAKAHGLDRYVPGGPSELLTGLAYGIAMNVLCFTTGDHLESIRASSKKRDASFAR